MAEPILDFQTAIPLNFLSAFQSWKNIFDYMINKKVRKCKQFTTPSGQKFPYIE